MGELIPATDQFLRKPSILGGIFPAIYSLSTWKPSAGGPGIGAMVRPATSQGTSATVKPAGR